MLSPLNWVFILWKNTHLKHLITYKQSMIVKVYSNHLKSMIPKDFWLAVDMAEFLMYLDLSNYKYLLIRTRTW
jgi:hypothetical protein